MMVWLLMPCFLLFFMSVLYVPTFWGIVFGISVIIGFLIAWFDQPPPKARRAAYRQTCREYRYYKKILEEMKKKGY